jgi:DNA-binding NarL/FixJ family response regulator
VRILVLSSHCDEFTVYRAEKARVHGFVDKNTNTVESLKEAISKVVRGKTYFSESFLRIKAARHSNTASFDKVLTDRERSILALIGEPLSDAEVSVRLGISIDTAQKHRFNILRKLGLQTTPELIRYARIHGFTLSVQPDDSGALLP